MKYAKRLSDAAKVYQSARKDAGRPVSISEAIQAVLKAVERMKRTGKPIEDPAFSEAGWGDALRSLAYEQRTGADGTRWQRKGPGSSWKRA